MNATAAAVATSKWIIPAQEVLAHLRALAATGSDFGVSVLSQFCKYGTVSINQEAALRRGMERAATAATGSTAAPTPINGLDLSTVPEGRYAVPSGDTRLKVLVKRPKAPSKWTGFIFVSDAAEYGFRQNYGSQRPFGKYNGKIQDELRAIAADPRAASIAYGKLVGCCGICGRTLEDAESVSRGIGPICAGKQGWL